MGNFAALIGCPSKDLARTDNKWEWYWDKDISTKANGWGPVWTSKYCIGGFWLGCFSPDDEILIERQDEEGYPPPFAGLYTDKDVAIDRLKRRKANFITLLPLPLQKAYSTLYDQWIDLIQKTFPDGIFLDCEDIFNMIGHEEGSESLRHHVQIVEAMDKQSHPIDIMDLGLTGLLGLGELSPHDAANQSAEQIVHHWRFSAFGLPNVESALWPPAPSEEEMAFARTVKAETQEQNPMKPIHAPQRKKPWWKIW